MCGSREVSPEVEAHDIVNVDVDQLGVLPISVSWTERQVGLRHAIQKVPAGHEGQENLLDSMRGQVEVSGCVPLRHLGVITRVDAQVSEKHGTSPARLTPGSAAGSRGCSRNDSAHRYSYGRSAAPPRRASVRRLSFPEPSREWLLLGGLVFAVPPPLVPGPYPEHSRIQR